MITLFLELKEGSHMLTADFFLTVDFDALFHTLMQHPVVEARLREEKRAAGGYCCIADEDGMPILIMKIGGPNPAKLGKYLGFCQEKANRLAKHSEHRLSRESRDPDANQWGGAIRAGEVIYSFSGLPEHLDEAYVFLIAMQEMDLSCSLAKEILNQFPNDFSDSLWEVKSDLDRRND